MDPPLDEVYLGEVLVVDKVSFGKYFVAATISGVVSKTLVAPVNYIKLVLQTQSVSSDLPKELHYKGFRDCLVRSVCERGLLSLWQGNLAAMLRHVPHQALNFSFNAVYARLLSPSSSLQSTLLWNLAAGGAAGATTSLFYYPFEYVGSRVLVDKTYLGWNREYLGMVDCARQILLRDGVRGFYRGYGVFLQGNFIYRASYFGCYDTIKSALPNPQQTSILVTWAIAQCVSLFSTLASYPFDTVRQRFLLQPPASSGRPLYRGALDCCRQTLRAEGLRGFYRGAAANIVKSVGSAVALVLYDHIVPAM